MPYIFSTRLVSFEVRREPYGAIVAPRRWSSFPLSLSPPRRHRHADGQFSTLNPPSPTFSSFGDACVKLCGLPSPSPVRNTHLCYSLTYVGDIKVVLP